MTDGTLGRLQVHALLADGNTVCIRPVEPDHDEPLRGAGRTPGSVERAVLHHLKAQAAGPVSAQAPPRRERT